MASLELAVGSPGREVPVVEVKSEAGWVVQAAEPVVKKVGRHLCS